MTRIAPALATILVVPHLLFAASSALAAPSKTYINPVTGRKCVEQVEGPQDAAPTWGKFYFKNSCAGTFIVQADLSNGKIRTNGVGPGETVHISCEHSKGECKGMRWGFK